LPLPLAPSIAASLKDNQMKPIKTHMVASPKFQLHDHAARDTEACKRDKLFPPHQSREEDEAPLVHTYPDTLLVRPGSQLGHTVPYLHKQRRSFCLHRREA
jgi:hypothetical protein